MYVCMYIYIYIYICVRVKSLPPVLYRKYSTRHEAEMANIARGEAECYITMEAKCRVLYFPYSTWQGSDLSVIKNFLNNHSRHH